MPEVAIDGDDLVVRLAGWDRVFALRREVRAPLAAVRDVAHDPAVARDPHGARWPGARIPGRVYAGTWLHPDGRWFWSVRRPSHAVRIDFDGQPFRRWVIDADDPEALVRFIGQAARASRGR